MTREVPVETVGEGDDGEVMSKPVTRLTYEQFRQGYRPTAYELGYTTDPDASQSSYGQGTPFTRVDMDETREQDVENSLFAALQEVITPKVGESFDSWNGRLNAARADVAAKVAQARAEGVQIDEDFSNNCISTAIANFNDVDGVASNGKFADPWGLYRSMFTPSNTDFRANPGKYGFENTFVFTPELGDEQDDDYDYTVGDYTDAYKERHRPLYNKNRLSLFNLINGNSNNTALSAGDIISMPMFAGFDANGNTIYHGNHAITYVGNGKNNSFFSSYAPGESGNSAYKKNTGSFNIHNNDSNNKYYGYHYIGTPEERAARLNYFNKYNEGVKKAWNDYNAVMDSHVDAPLFPVSPLF